jgi:uncharacterized protein (DUF169 family)
MILRDEVGSVNREEFRARIIRLNCALDLARKAVGIKFLHTEEEYRLADAKPVTAPINYCVMVRLATQVRALKAIGNNLACLAGARALGLKEIDAYHRSGQNGKKLGLYHDMPTAKRTRDGMSYCDHQAFGIMVKPLEDYDSEPDVVIMVSHPYNIMRIVQGYSYYSGIQSAFKMTGNQAICSESTAYPYLSKDINVSLLCIGTRHKAGWGDHELAVGFPISLFNKIVDGVMNTVNIMEDNQKKKVIEKKLLENEIDDLEIKYDSNYYR